MNTKGRIVMAMEMTPPTAGENIRTIIKINNAVVKMSNIASNVSSLRLVTDVR